MPDGRLKLSSYVVWRLTTLARGFSQAFYREKIHEKHFGYKDLESFMVGFWETWATSKGVPGIGPNIIAGQVRLTLFQIRKISLRCCEHGRVAIAPCKNRTMVTLRKPWRVSRQRHWFFLRRRICTFRKIVFCVKMLLTSSTDNDGRRPEDSEYEVANMRSGIGQLEMFPSIWGHWAGGPGDSVDDVKWLDEQLRAFFAKHGKRDQ